MAYTDHVLFVITKCFRVRYNECKSLIPGTWEAEAEGLEVGRKPRQFGKLISKNNRVTQLSHDPSQKKKV